MFLKCSIFVFRIDLIEKDREEINLYSENDHAWLSSPLKVWKLNITCMGICPHVMLISVYDLLE